jgi:type I restriction enzyme, S subunit
MNEPVSVIPNHAGRAVKTLSSISTLLRRGTAPVYVESSDVYAIGQRCVTVADFDASASRPHSERAMSRVLEPQLGDVLINSTGTGTIGRSVIFNDESRRYIVDGHVTLIRPAQQCAVPQWLNEILRSPWVQRYLESHCYAGSTNQIELSSSALSAIPVAVPTVPEQRWISEVLCTLDEEIRAAQDIIAKIKVAKTGLLQDLLTQGVDEQGRLRPPQLQAPYMYKESPFGAVPLQWEITSLARSLNGMPTNGVYKPASAIGKGTLLVGQTAFTRDREIDYRFARRAVMTREDMDRYGLASGDILVSRVFATLDGVGQPALVEDLPEPAVFESNMMRLRIDESVAIPEFIFHLLQTNKARRHVVRNANLSNQASINQAALTSLPMALPSKSEQLRICSMLQSVDQQRRAEAEVLHASRLLKQGLTADLLTGRVRLPEEISS